MNKFINTHGPAIAAGVIVGVIVLSIQYFIIPKLNEQKQKVKKENKQ